MSLLPLTVTVVALGVSPQNACVRCSGACATLHRLYINQGCVFKVESLTAYDTSHTVPSNVAKANAPQQLAL